MSKGRHRAHRKPPPLLRVGVGGLIGAAVILAQPPMPAPVNHRIESLAVSVLTQPKASRPVPPKPVTAIRAAISKIGRPYVWGAKGHNDTFDCSGLTQYAWRQAGIEIGPSTYDQVQRGQPVRGPVKAGDLIFTRWGSRGPEHVALAVSPSEIVEAPGRGMTVRKSRMPATFVARRVTP